MRGQLSPKLAGFIEQVNQAIDDAKAQGVVPNPALAREKLAALDALVSTVPEISYINDKWIETPEVNIPVRVYSPDPAKALPVMVYFHGGGHMCGDIELYDPMCRKMALAANCVVISVEYRLAPEFPYPCGLDDCAAVVKRYKEALTEVAFLPHVAIGGDSAGGAICTSLTMRKVSDPELPHCKQVLIYPSVDYTLSQTSVTENGVGYFLEKPRIEWYFDNYFNASDDRQAASPLFNPVDQNSPKSLIVVAGCDPLRDEGLAYAQKLTAAGVETQVERFDDMIHAFMNIEDLVPQECHRLFSLIGQFIND